MNRKSPRRILAGAPSAAALGLALGGATALAADKPERVHIGITAFLSGPASVFGEPAKAAAEMMIEQINAEGTTIVMVTHDPELAARAARNVHIVDGTASDVTAVATAQPMQAGARADAPTPATA